MIFSYYFKKALRIIKISLFLSLSISCVSSAQSNIKIFGTVIAEDNGYPISGARIKILNTNYQISSDNSGDFFFLNIPVGFYNLEVTSGGFEKKIIRDVEIVEDVTRRIRVNL